CNFIYTFVYTFLDSLYANLFEDLLYITNHNPLFKCCQFIVIGRHKFLCYISLKPCVQDSPYNSWIIKFLCLIDFISSGNTTGMIMADMFMVFFNGGNYITFHNLHMIDIIQKFKVRRAKFFGKCHSPRGGIALVIRMVHFTVQ